MSYRGAPGGAGQHAAGESHGGIDSYELRQIVNVATSYLESGMLEDAEDLLQEIIESGAHEPEISALARRIDAARGVVIAEQPIIAASAPRRTLVNLTAPLPGIEQQPRDVQRLTAEAERDFAERRLESARDVTLFAISRAPDFVPLYVRLAELSIACGDETGAERIAAEVAAVAPYFNVDIEPMLATLHAALNPDDVDALVAQAWRLIERRSSALEPFVPAAIEASLEANPLESRKLARAYIELRPNAQDAVRAYLRAVVGSCELAEIVDAFERYVDMSTQQPEQLYVRTVVAVVERSENWLEWLTAAARALRTDPAAWPEVERAAAATSQYLPEDRGALALAVLAGCAARWSEVLEQLDLWQLSAGAQRRASDEAFIAHMLSSAAADELNRPEAGPALLDAIQCALNGVAVATMANTDILGRAVTLQMLFDLYTSFVVTSGETARAIAQLGNLRDKHPDRLELRLCLADLLIKARRVSEGVHELRDVAQQYEKRGDFSQMVTAMRRMSQAVPNNIEIKAMLVDVYVQRGVLDEALVELQSLADLYSRSGRLDDAVRALTRAADIAYATAGFTLGQDLFDRATQLNPDDVPVRHAAVAFFLQTGAVQRAIDQLRQVVRIVLEQRDPDEAVAALHQIIGLAPQDTDAYHRLGEVLTTMGEYGQAERVYRRLAALAPGDPVLQAKQSALAVLAATQ